MSKGPETDQGYVHATVALSVTVDRRLPYSGSRAKRCSCSGIMATVPALQISLLINMIHFLLPVSSPLYSYEGYFDLGLDLEPRLFNS